MGEEGQDPVCGNSCGRLPKACRPWIGHARPRASPEPPAQHGSGPPHVLQVLRDRQPPSRAACSVNHCAPAVRRTRSSSNWSCEGLPGCKPGTAKVALQKDGCAQTDITGLCVADTKRIRCQRHSAVATVISKLCLSQARSRKISMHKAGKCLEKKLRFFPVAV